MKTLTLIFFAEFALLALAAPLAGLRRTAWGKLALALAGPAALALVLVALVRLGIWPSRTSAGTTVTLILELQAVAAGFALAVMGAAALAARRWPLGGPLVVALVALAVLASPFWGDAVLDLPLARETVAGPVLAALVTPNPLFTVSDTMQYDWMHSSVLYGRLSRLGEDFMPPTSGWRPLGAVYGSLGLLLVLADWLFGRGRKLSGRSAAGLL